MIKKEEYLNHDDAINSKLDDIINKNKTTQGSLNNILGRAKEVYGDISESVQMKISAELKMPISKIYGVASFSDSKKLIKERNEIDKLTENLGIIESNKDMLLKKIYTDNLKNIGEYIASGGYKALKNIFNSIPQEIINTIKQSNLVERSGAIQYVGDNWQQIKDEFDTTKYICSYGAEDDFGGFKDMKLIENNPHLIIEGMLIAGYAVEANKGFIHVKSNWKTAIKHMQKAIDEAIENKILGNNICDTDFSFELELRIGDGDFISCEETSIIASMEGNRGEPLLTASQSLTHKLFRKPVLLSSIETVVNIPEIIISGSEHFRSIGINKNSGTKLMVVLGDVKRRGLIEVPMGTSLREVIFNICGGINGDRKLKAVQIGGWLGGLINEDELDTVIDYETFNTLGLSMVSGGILVMDEDTCVVHAVKYFTELITAKSCGRCPICRIGTKRMFEILKNISEYNGKKEDLENLETLAKNIKVSTNCRFGKTASDCVLTTLRKFREEYLSYFNQDNSEISNNHCIKFSVNYNIGGGR